MAQLWHNYQNVILADEISLGKTMQATRFRIGSGPFLIIVELPAISHWERELVD
jgi:SNF2 family DNA or RNA helicase